MDAKIHIVRCQTLPFSQRQSCMKTLRNRYGDSTKTWDRYSIIHLIAGIMAGILFCLSDNWVLRGIGGIVIALPIWILLHYLFRGYAILNTRNAIMDIFLFLLGYYLVIILAYFYVAFSIIWIIEDLLQS